MSNTSISRCPPLFWARSPRLPWECEILSMLGSVPTQHLGIGKCGWLNMLTKASASRFVTLYQVYKYFNLLSGPKKPHPTSLGFTLGMALALDVCIPRLFLSSGHPPTCCTPDTQAGSWAPLILALAQQGRWVSCLGFQSCMLEPGKLSSTERGQAAAGCAGSKQFSSAFPRPKEALTLAWVD